VVVPLQVTLVLVLVWVLGVMVIILEGPQEVVPLIMQEVEEQPGMLGTVVMAPME
jgi:hypothetical protein